MRRMVTYLIGLILGFTLLVNSCTPRRAFTQSMCIVDEQLHFLRQNSVSWD